MCILFATLNKVIVCIMQLLTKVLHLHGCRAPLLAVWLLPFRNNISVPFSKKKMSTKFSLIFCLQCKPHIKRENNTNN